MIRRWFACKLGFHFWAEFLGYEFCLHCGKDGNG